LEKVILRNEDIRRVLMSVPRSHRHLRALIETKDGAFYVFQEATVANMVRAYVTLKTHPSIYGIELINKEYDGDLRKGYAKSQLIESGKGSREVIEELEKLLR
jgi:hypothetical protein